MATLQIDLPENQIAWIEDQVRDGRYASLDDYLCDLMRRDQERDANVSAREVALDELVEDAQKNDMGY
jgi:antitoxin ParD1/3/4